MADNRIYNFSAGPSMLPVPVLERCAADMLNYQGSGMSVMEMRHRSKVYDGIIKETEATPVSYTHLDVYKRQQLSAAALRAEFVPDA